MDDNVSDFNSLQVDDLLQQLNSTPANFVVQATNGNSDVLPVPTEPVKEDDLGEYIIKQTTELVNQTVGAVTQIKNIAVTSSDPDTISALADVIKAANGSIDNLNKIHIQNKKSKNARDIAEIQLKARAREDAPITNNIITIGSREEVLKILDQAKQQSKAIEAEYTDISK